jgi:hypothetical protein
VTYISTAGNTTNAVFDTTGYFEEWEPAHPVITTTPSAGGAIGTVLTDTATLTGADSASPDGRIDFWLFPPSVTPPCNNNGLAVAHYHFDPIGGLSATTPGYTTTVAGVYHWKVFFGGDARDFPVGSPCVLEPVTIKASPTLTTDSSGGGIAGIALNDSASLSGGLTPTGAITFNLYGKGDLTCSSAPIFTKVVTLSGTSAATTPGFAPLTGAGTYEWTASYPGDALNNAASSACGLEPVILTAPIV